MTTPLQPQTEQSQQPELSPTQQYVMRQVQRMSERGATNNEIRNWLHHIEQVPLKTVIEPPPEQPDTPTTLRGLSMNAMQGITLGWGDEVVGGLLGIATGESWNQGIDEYRKELAQFNAEHRKAALAASIGGTLLTLPLTAGLAAAKGASLGATLTRAGGIGAAYGAISAAGETQGNLSERAKAALIGAPLGAALGVTSTLGVQALSALARPIVTKALETPWAQALQSRLVGTPAQQARRLVTQAIARSPSGLEGTTQRAYKLMSTGAPVTLADVVDDDVLGLATAAVAQRSPTTQSLVEQIVTRQAEQGDRMLGRAFRALRIGLKNVYDAQDALVAQRAEQAAPLYESAYKQSFQVSDRLRRILQERRFSAAYNAGADLANLEDAAGTGRGLPVAILPENMTDLTTLPIRGLDYLKRGIDVLEGRIGAPGQPSLSRVEARAMRSMLNELVDDASKQVPDYNKARAVYRGFSEAKDALQLGYGNRLGEEGAEAAGPNFMRKPPELVQRELAALPPSQQEFYRLGALQALSDAIYGRTAELPNVAASRFGGLVNLYGKRTDPIMARRITALFNGNEKAARDFMDYVHAESRISATAQRLTRSTAAASPALSAEHVPVRGSVRGTLFANLGEIVANRSRTGWLHSISDEVSNVFAKGATSPAELTALLNDLQATLLRIEQPSRVVTAAAGLSGRAAGTVAALR